MSCYHPLIGIDTGEKTANGKIKYWIRCREQSADFQKEIDLNDHILIPCGKCLGCRLDYSRSWADRMMLELETKEKAMFVTLTYNNAHLPGSEYEEFYYEGYLPLDGAERFGEDGTILYYPTSSTLDKRDVQLFLKRLRREFDGRDEKHPYREIRFFLSGEYGPNTNRPHYHAILFGLSLDDFSDIVPHGRNELGQQYYISSSFADLWSNGFSLLSPVSWQTCAYVARYIMKKLNGDWSIPNYEGKNRIREFSLMSRKPGIGKKYLELHPECLDFESINISTPEGGLKIKIPKYYLKQLKYVPKKFDKEQNGYVEAPEENPLLDPERYDKIMSERKKFAEDSMLLELQKTNLSLLDYLEEKERKHAKGAKLLKRGDL